MGVSPKYVIFSGGAKREQGGMAISLRSLRGSDLTFHFFSAECLPTTSSHRLRYFLSE
ncbi:hypothetical protein HOLleu_08003 [Holothuria leucospilota]|uniref:Uncharacterized protein n=1 Tax=Holothuria leucospilota TaxID=206669 RepID=A0A9Q1HG02_HOLLE|nr:hypothetical protein HOLleu_08003 [Holothuria leucospilota]